MARLDASNLSCQDKDSISPIYPDRELCIPDGVLLNFLPEQDIYSAFWDEDFGTSRGGHNLLSKHAYI